MQKYIYLIFTICVLAIYSCSLIFGHDKVRDDGAMSYDNNTVLKMLYIISKDSTKLINIAKEIYSDIGVQPDTQIVGSNSIRIFWNNISMQEWQTDSLSFVMGVSNTYYRDKNQKLIYDESSLKIGAMGQNRKDLIGQDLLFKQKMREYLNSKLLE